MKRRPALLMLLATLLLWFMAAHSISAKAEDSNFLSFPSGITIYSPLNATYHSRYLFLNLSLYSAGAMGSLDPNVNMHYSIDGEFNGSVPLAVTNPGLHVVTNAAAYVSLPMLSEGSHWLTLFLFGHNQRSFDPRYLSYVETVYFSVGTGTSDVPPPGWVAPDVTPQILPPQDLTLPRITILSPVGNESFEAFNLTDLEVSLNFAVNEAASHLSFSLDGQPNATIAGNFTFRGLSAGLHNLTVYAWDSVGNVGASETVNFTIKVIQQAEPKSDSSFALPLAASGLSLAGVGIASVMYLKKRKSND